jgi:AcrR family transcriptional regulator
MAMLERFSAPHTAPSRGFSYSYGRAAEGRPPGILDSVGARDRIVDTAYDLFSRHGVRAVGVDRIVAESGVAKMSLYRHFPSKDDLVLTFLQERHQRWTNDWLRAEAERRGDTAAERMLAIFDVFGEWFAVDDFEGCSFINVLLEYDDRGHRIRQASVGYLRDIRSFLRELAGDAGAADPEALAHQWHILMKGSIVAAGEGDQLAASRAREIGELLLAREAIAV